MESQQQAKGDVITVTGQKSMLDSSTDREQIP